MEKTQFIVNAEKSYIDRKADAYLLLNHSKLRIDNRRVLKGKYKVISSDITGDEYLARRKYICGLCERLIDYYGGKFNRCYNFDFARNQWQLILGHWLEPFTLDAYDRFLTIKNISLEGYYFLKKKDAIEISTLQQFGTYVNYSSAYQNMLYARMLELLDQDVRVKKSGIGDALEKAEVSYEKQCQIWTRRIKKICKNPNMIIKKLIKKPIREETVDTQLSGEVLVVQSRMPKEMEDELSNRSDGKIVFLSEKFFYDRLMRIIDKVSVDKKRRKNIFQGFLCENEFEKLLEPLMIDFMPRSLFECLPELVKDACEITSAWNFRKIYHSAHMTETFLTCCALMRGKGVPICDIQHSAVYAYIFCTGFNEYSLFDRFLTWGWKTVKIPYSCDIRPVAMSRLPQSGEEFSVRRKKKILLVTGNPMFCDGGCGETFDDYVMQQKAFISNLTKELRAKLVVRMDERDELTDLRKWCKKKYPEVHFESIGDMTFTESVLESELIVCDYYGSPHIEALILGRPFVMYSGGNILVKNESTNRYLMELKRVGIYAENGKAMAQEILRHKDFQKWLSSDDVTEALETYKLEMTGADKNIIDTWYKELIGD